MIRRLRIHVLIVLSLVVVCGTVNAQSVSLPSTSNGSLIQAQASIGPREGFGATIGAGYTLAGVLDLGLRFGADVVVSERSVTSDIGMFYGFAALKQSDEVPFSAQIYGSYSFQSESSDFLSRNRLLHEARGYRLGVAAVHDLSLGSGTALRMGAITEYRNYLSTTTIGFTTAGFSGVSEVDYGEYPLVERLAGFEYGAYLGLLLGATNQRSFVVGAAVLLDPDFQIRVRPDFQLLLSR